MYTQTSNKIDTHTRAHTCIKQKMQHAGNIQRHIANTFQTHTGLHISTTTCNENNAKSQTYVKQTNKQKPYKLLPLSHNKNM